MNIEYDNVYTAILIPGDGEDAEPTEKIVNMPVMRYAEWYCKTCGHMESKDFHDLPYLQADFCPRCHKKI